MTNTRQAKRVPFTIKARSDILAQAQKAALEEALRAGAVWPLSPSLFQAIVIYAGQTAMGLNLPTIADIKKAVQADKRGTLTVDLKLFIVCDGSETLY